MCPRPFHSAYPRTILVWLTFSSLLWGGAVWSQPTRSDLEKERAQLLEQIASTNTLLTSTKANRERTLDTYYTLQQQIDQRQQLIENLNLDLGRTDSSIVRATQVVEGLTRDAATLREQYGVLVRTAYRHRQQHSWLQFLFSSESVNQAFRRWRYLRQYEDYRSRQADFIQATQRTLEAKTLQLRDRRKEKATLLLEQQNQQAKLNTELADMNQLLRRLKQDESRLSNELADHRKNHRRLNAAIEKMIREEIARANARARKPEAVGGVSVENAAGKSFSQRKGSLPWPVSSGVITKGYGRQPHPTLAGIQVTNNGIDIRTEEGATVYAIASGEVVGKQYIPGNQNMLIIKHGNYYSVYANLETVYADRGETIQASQRIGKLSKLHPTVHFEIWKDKQRLDPTGWVHKQ